MLLCVFWKLGKQRCPMLTESQVEDDADINTDEYAIVQLETNRYKIKKFR